MEIIKIDSTKQNYKHATIDLNIDEIIDIVNLISESLHLEKFNYLSENKRQDYTYLYYQLYTLSDLTQYGKLTETTFKIYNDFLKLKKQNKVKESK